MRQRPRVFISLNERYGFIHSSERFGDVVISLAVPIGYLRDSHDISATGTFVHVDFIPSRRIFNSVRCTCDLFTNKDQSPIVGPVQLSFGNHVS